MKGVKLQAAYARRRDVDQMKFEKTKEVDRYFDKWQKITTRYEQWTAPEYYKQVEESNMLVEKNKRKSEMLAKRREHLRQILSQDKLKYEYEIQALKRSRNKAVPADILRGIQQTNKRTEEESRKRELETRLYKKWRYGFCEDSVLLNARSDHEALAKMNWLDKQIANQVEKERLDRDSEERKLRIKEQMIRDEENRNNRQKLRDEEIKTLELFQSKHINELTRREQEASDLHVKESQLRRSQLNVKEERSKLEIHVAQRNERIKCPYNVRRIKMLLRERSEAVRKDLRFDIELLDRLLDDNKDNQHIQTVREQLEMQFDLEIQKQTQIEAMYESEAKIALQSQQEIWLKESLMREKLLKSILAEKLKGIDAEMEYTSKRQVELKDLKESHRKAIENTNERLQSLLRENDQSSSSSSDDSACAINKIGANLESLRIGCENNGPKFGRKKIAWT